MKKRILKSLKQISLKILWTGWFVKNEFVGNMNFKNDVFKKYLKNIKSLTAIMKLIYSLFQEMK